jgi:uncharacterized protein YqeY
MSLKQRITDDMKSAMRAGDKRRLAVIRLILAAIKQREVDDRIDSLNDDQVLAALDKMVKQRRESVAQYEKAGRTDLAEQESYEIGILQDYLPAALDESEIEAMIAAAIAESDAASVKDMGKVMALLKPQMQGRADMAAVSAKVKSKLGS